MHQHHESPVPAWEALVVRVRKGTTPRYITTCKVSVSILQSAGRLRFSGLHYSRQPLGSCYLLTMLQESPLSGGMCGFSGEAALKPSAVA